MFATLISASLSTLTEAGRKLFTRKGAKPLSKEQLRLDHQINLATTPPDDEYIGLKCIWGVEFYTPTHIHGLTNRLNELGLGTRQNSVDWMQEIQSSHSVRTKTSLGVFVHEGSSPTESFQHHVPLLPSVEYATGQLHILSPSVVCIIVCFVFNGETESLYDKALRLDRETSSAPAIRDPRDQKFYAVAQIRNDISTQVKGWFHENLPRLFSSGLLTGELPTCELITLRKVEPFPSGQSLGLHNEYLNILGLWSRRGVWMNQNNPDLKLIRPSSTASGYEYHSVLTINESNCELLALAHLGRSDKATQIQCLDMIVSDLLVIEAMLPMLDGYMRRISGMRLTVASASQQKRKGLQTLEQLEQDILYGIDIAAVTYEIEEFFEQELPLTLAAEFELMDYTIGGQPFYLKESLASRARRLIHQLREVGPYFREHLTQYGTVVGARENINFQRKIVFLTVVVAILTFVTVIFYVLQGTIGE